MLDNIIGQLLISPYCRSYHMIFIKSILTHVGLKVGVQLHSFLKVLWLKTAQQDHVVRLLPQLTLVVQKVMTNYRATHTCEDWLSHTHWLTSCLSHSVKSLLESSLFFSDTRWLTLSDWFKCWSEWWSVVLVSACFTSCHTVLCSACQRGEAATGVMDLHWCFLPVSWLWSCISPEWRPVWHHWSVPVLFGGQSKPDSDGWTENRLDD